MTPTHDEINRYFAEKLGEPSTSPDMLAHVRASPFCKHCKPKRDFNCFTPEGISQDGLKVLRWAEKQIGTRDNEREDTTLLQDFIAYTYEVIDDVQYGGYIEDDRRKIVIDTVSGDIITKLYVWMKEREG